VSLVSRRPINKAVLAIRALGIQPANRLQRFSRHTPHQPETCHGSQEAQAIINTSPLVTNKGTKPPFPIEDVRTFFARNIEALRTAGQDEIAESLESLDLDALLADLEQLEQRLTEIEEKMISRLRASAIAEQLHAIAREIDCELKPYRNTMTSDQIAMLERKFLERRLLGTARLPRLSLFYL